MQVRYTDTIVPIILAIFCIVISVQWVTTPLERLDTIKLRVPGLDLPNKEQLAIMDARGDGLAVVGDPVAGEGVPSESTDEWPCFRGADRTAIHTTDAKLARSWPAEGPTKLWEIELSPGYAGAAISQGRVFVLDYDEAAKRDVLRCLSLDDGRTIWTNGYTVELAYNHGFTRTVPAIVDNYVITMGPRCHLACWDLETGKNLWLKSLVDDFGTKLPEWYTGQNPLIHNDQLIIAPSGDSMLIAFDYKTGEELWKSPNPRDWKMTHCSIVTMEYEDREMYLYCGSGGIVGIDSSDGKILFDSTSWPVFFATAPSPVALPDGRIFLSSGYNRKIGSLFLKLKKSGDGYEAEVEKTLTPKQFNAEQHTPIFRDNHIFGAHKKFRGQLACLDLQGNTIWTSGSHTFDDGPFMFINDLCYGMNDHGALMMGEVSTSQYIPLAKHQVFSGGAESWGPLAYANGKLILRDASRMACVKID